MKHLMNGSNKKSEVFRWVVFIAMSLLPLFFVVKGIIRLCSGEIPTFAFSVAFFIVPILIIVGCFYIIRDKDTSALGKIILNVLLVVVLSIIGLVIVFFGRFKELHSYMDEDAIVKYNSAVFNEWDEMPDLNETGEFSEIN